MSKLSERIRNGMTIRHSKSGQLYKVLFESTHTETGELLVHYYAVPDKDVTLKMWARPKQMLDDLVEHEGKQVPRFVEVGDV